MGLLNPVNLLYLLSLGVLVAIYLRARSRPTLEVSSLLLFEEAAAPVANRRILRFDLLFWLETAALSALGLALCGAYLRMSPPPAHHRHRALVFDLGAAMGARDGRSTRLDEARLWAERIVSAAAPGDRFSVIGYALEAHVIRAETGSLAAVRAALNGLSAQAVPARPAALSAALAAARGARQIDLFDDRPPSPRVLDQIAGLARLAFHKVGSPATNLAIAALDPGVLKSGPGRCVVRNFSDRSAECELAIDLDGRPVFHGEVMIEPRAQTAVSFGPLRAGGLLHAHIVTRDALAADNDRYAYLPKGTPRRALVLSSDQDVRDDLARVLLAVSQNLLVTAADPTSFAAADKSARFTLAVMYDCEQPALEADSRLYIYPRPSDQGSPGSESSFRVEGTVPLAELQGEAGEELSQAVLLGPTRVLWLAPAMEPMAEGTGAGEHSAFPVVALGRDARGRLGVIAFDVDNHLLLDPDRLEALVLTIDLVKQLIEPQDLQVVSTGQSVTVPAAGTARIIAPDGSVTTETADRMGVILVRPLAAGRYEIQSAAGSALVLANYYDAGESDLSAGVSRGVAGGPAPGLEPRAAAAAAPPQIRPIDLGLVTLALLAMLAEAAILARRALNWNPRNV